MPMGYVVYRANVTVSGPIFDGKAEAAAREWVGDVITEVTKRGVQEIHDLALGMDKTGRGTGHYAGMITSEVRSYDHQIITDQDIIYGPWLEGVSKRNQSTRFKGYHAFRKTKQKLQGIAGDVAEEKLRDYLPRMNGEGA